MSDIDFSLEKTISGKDILFKLDRNDRFNWIKTKINDDDLYFMQDGEMSEIMFSEMLKCFINGLYISSIIVGFSFIERSIAGRLFFLGHNSLANEKSSKLIHIALEKTWLSETEFYHLEKLRGLRNPITHFRGPSTDKRPEKRAILKNVSICHVIEEDAKLIVESAIHVMSKTSI